MSNLFNDFKEVFRHVDKDGDGKISSSELQLCTKSIGMNLSNEDIESSIEFDENGLLGFEELAKLVEMHEEEDEEEKKIKELREAFKMFEMEGKGYITPESLKQMLSRLGTSKNIEECKAMICRFDLNGDGVLSFDEFKIMML